MPLVNNRVDKRRELKCPRETLELEGLEVTRHWMIEGVWYLSLKRGICNIWQSDGYLWMDTLLIACVCMLDWKSLFTI